MPSKKLTSIDGGKKAKDEPVCQHCALVPESVHPYWSCPRIKEAQVTDDGWAVSYWGVEWPVIRQQAGLGEGIQVTLILEDEGE